MNRLWCERRKSVISDVHFANMALRSEPSLINYAFASLMLPTASYDIPISSGSAALSEQRVNAAFPPARIQFVIHLRNFNNKFQGLVRSMKAETDPVWPGGVLLLGRDLEIDFRSPDFNYELRALANSHTHTHARVYITHVTHTAISTTGRVNIYATFLRFASRSELKSASRYRARAIESLRADEGRDSTFDRPVGISRCQSFFHPSRAWGGSASIVFLFIGLFDN